MGWVTVIRCDLRGGPLPFTAGAVDQFIRAAVMAYLGSNNPADVAAAVLRVKHYMPGATVCHLIVEVTPAVGLVALADLSAMVRPIPGDGLDSASALLQGAGRGVVIDLPAGVWTDGPLPLDPARELRELAMSRFTSPDESVCEEPLPAQTKTLLRRVADLADRCGDLKELLRS